MQTLRRNFRRITYSLTPGGRDCASEEKDNTYPFFRKQQRRQTYIKPKALFSSRTLSVFSSRTFGLFSSVHLASCFLSSHPASLGCALASLVGCLRFTRELDMQCFETNIAFFGFAVFVLKFTTGTFL